jgi:hypothetical protein
MLDRYGDIALHEISIHQLGNRDALPVAIFGHEQRPKLVGHIVLPWRGVQLEAVSSLALESVARARG